MGLLPNFSCYNTSLLTHGLRALYRVKEPPLWRYQLRMWAYTGTTSYWKGSLAVINWKCPPFLIHIRDIIATITGQDTRISPLCLQCYMKIIRHNLSNDQQYYTASITLFWCIIHGAHAVYTPWWYVVYPPEHCFQCVYAKYNALWIICCVCVTYVWHILHSVYQSRCHGLYVVYSHVP